jgi:hypothetical protein
MYEVAVCGLEGQLAALQRMVIDSTVVVTGSHEVVTTCAHVNGISATITTRMPTDIREMRW